ncbi:hypothetical protein A3H80_03915 [Candidatus Roizmanbacteria bacterium RIFCSPLOWO2_02_FULL_37_19]|uniref:Uncharacterized protein n=1 Tax=Candidatus Roizmanbacteria bacterium RIFCSPHIGHO2_02_FULL_37_24 TaxID=1802037 RepID=A0A1F7GWL0_9BACT|nr:MAG: hypothetical protein A2862_03875 [Candidatus Roizmanbacteria bacterium RIFCSPHIGHO2_01_FULL_38_41]OGK23311.1 MAG: hypothetical protein A3C24_03905 [Candidatus Roizmanbacteria bacterium RIFCSPHIGHO2_02_FULL_37_24]OGK32324.1 MAG: hypothetical protein A3E10_04145 [Candidatus Roizmanbacteria bacterium RIFCSPHIGHO2_12_FULL_37_23]OGK44656.1 MAG: hypothetical protein A2956_03820 [Candidatus Roizmanbacteria bacterium RIFCSPLOWO2_01_FULL_37_57]OGK54842.1 MAG: hypothetical protein A3H80_03915 [Ca
MKQLPSGYTNGKKLVTFYHKQQENYWITSGKRRALQLFTQMAQRVPAYRKFLKKHRIDYKKIKSFKDFQQIPTIDKQSYLIKYPLSELCWDGKLSEGQWEISATSGSTGEPFYFPRNRSQDLQYAAVAEAYLLTNFQIDKKSTLYIIGFPMGVWIGGVFTYQALRYIADRTNYNLSVISPGIHKEEIIKAVKKLGHYFDQVIIGSYGPFLKDTLDDGEDYGLNWKKYDLNFIFSAEGFTEKFRDYILRKVGKENKPYTTTLNHYGTVDLGTMAYETPISILARRRALDNKSLYQELFGDIQKLPTLTQYDPKLFYFESLDGGRLVCSAYSGLPLVRYDLKDNGGVATFSTVKKIFSNHGINLMSEAQKAGISTTIWQLPYVYVYERSDFSVSFYAFQIYPETIRKALQVDQLEKKVTGKFTMMVKFDRKQNQYFEVNVELKQGVSPKEQIKKEIQHVVLTHLLEENSEYRETYAQKGSKVLPKIVLWKYEDPHYFKPGTKQKWVKN